MQSTGNLLTAEGASSLILTCMPPIRPSCQHCTFSITFAKFAEISEDFHLLNASN